MHTWYTCIADENANCVYHLNQYNTVIHKTVLNIDECEVLVLPVHSQETRRISQDGGNLLLSGTEALLALIFC